jgi:hypothetical protein
MLVYFVIIKEKSTWGSHPVKKSFFFLCGLCPKRGGGGQTIIQIVQGNFSRMDFDMFQKGGGLVDPNPNYVKALSWLNLDIMVKKGPCSCPRKQGGVGVKVLLTLSKYE